MSAQADRQLLLGAASAAKDRYAVHPGHRLGHAARMKWILAVTRPMSPKCVPLDWRCDSVR
jgi:hypothetical protein